MRENFENDITGEASPPGRASALSVRSANLLFLITSLCLTIIPAVLDSLIPGDSPVLTYIIMFLTAFLLCRKEKVSFPRAFRFRKVQPRTLLLAAVITIALQPFASLIANLTNLVFPDLLEMAEDSLYGGSFLMNMVTVALIPGVCEEFLLRGNVFNAYRSTGRIRAAVLLSALLFGLLHQNATQLFYAFAIGLVLALLFDFINGFHDSANAIATSVSTRALPPNTAVMMAALLEFAGAMISTGVAKTIGGDIVSSTFTSPAPFLAWK